MVTHMTNKNLFALAIAALATLATSSALAQGRYTDGLSAGRLVEGVSETTMDFEPYAGSYLPRHEGPLSRSNDGEIARMIENGFGECDLVHQVIKDNANRKTTEKFDAAVERAEGSNPGLTERYNREGYNEKAETWEGFCHLWAAAALDPAVGFLVSMDRIYADVPFGIGDLRELVTFNYPRSGTLFYGKRNYEKSKPRKNRNEELDAMDLLSLFDEFVGPDKPGLVIDVDPGYMVWNQPVYKVTKNATRKQGHRDGGATYDVVLTAEYGLEGEYAHRGGMIGGSKSWNLTVRTDREGNISSAKFKRNRGDDTPDFAWVPLQKNTNTNMERLKRIAEEGVSVKDIEELCKGLDGLTKEKFEQEGVEDLAQLLDAICPVLDQNKIADYVRRTAERIGVDYSVLDAALASTTPAHS